MDSLNHMDVDLDFHAVGTMMSDNLAELLARDLELSSDIFISKNMTAGIPQLQPNRAVSTRSMVSDLTSDADSVDAVPAPIMKPSSSAGLSTTDADPMAAANVYFDVMNRLNKVASEADSIQESLAILREDYGHSKSDLPRRPATATRPLSEAMHDGIVPRISTSFSGKAANPDRESVFSLAQHSTSNFMTSPPLEDLSLASPTMVSPLIQVTGSRQSSMQHNGLAPCARLPSMSAFNGLQPSSLPRRSVSGAASVMSYRSDPDTSWIDSDNEEDVEMEEDMPRAAGMTTLTSRPPTSHANRRISMPVHKASFSSRSALASPPATPPREKSPPPFPESTSTEAHGTFGRGVKFQPVNYVAYEPISPPLRPISSHMEDVTVSPLTRGISCRVDTSVPTFSGKFPTRRSSLGPRRLQQVSENIPPTPEFSVPEDTPMQFAAFGTAPRLPTPSSSASNKRFDLTMYEEREPVRRSLSSARRNRFGQG